MKYSKQREAILEYLLSTREHPSADTVFAEVKKTQPNISLGTVYRNLAQLCENGRILKIDTGSGKDHYDGFTHKHYHFVCRECDRVIDVDMPEIFGLNEKVSESLGLRVDDHSMIFYGLCADCDNKKCDKQKNLRRN